MTEADFGFGLKAVLTVFLDSADAQHPLLELLGESIARDHGLEGIEDPRPLIRQMLLLPLCPQSATAPLVDPLRRGQGP